MAESYHPDVEIDYSRTLPDLLPTRGVDQMLGWAEAAFGTFKDASFDVLNLIEAGDSVIAVTRFSGRGGISEALVEMNLVYVFEYCDGLVVAARTFRTEQD